jgi:tyrosyl-tRNA synthetase
LVDKDGQKVGKTTGNALFLDSTPEAFYGGVMAFPDETIALSFELLTECDLTGIEEKVKADPMGEKKRLAFEIVKLLWGEKAAKDAQGVFENAFQKHEADFSLKIPLKESLAATIAPFSTNASISNAKSLIEQGGVEINGTQITDKSHKPAVGDKIRIGKRVFGTVTKKM